jgi:DNA (cytosine-5)-methyltransferase 1
MEAPNLGSNKKNGPRSLIQVAREHWATPQARDFRNGQAKRWHNPQRSRNLNDQVKVFPTPTATMYKGSSEKHMFRKNGKSREMDRLDTYIQFAEGCGQLNPTWVEWLQGFPPGWTDLKA